MKSRFTRDPREVNEYVAKLDPRRELVYRLALRGAGNGIQSSFLSRLKTPSWVAMSGRKKPGQVQKS